MATESEIFSTIRDFLLSAFTEGTEVIAAQANRVPEPKSADFVLMTPVSRERLATNTETGAISYSMPIKLTAQFDVHGPNSGDNVQLISLLGRSPYANQFFRNVGASILYVDEAVQVPFVNGAGQYENRWTINLVLQYTLTITLKQDYANKVTVNNYGI